MIHERGRWARIAYTLCGAFLGVSVLAAQTPATPAPSKDPLGRDSPLGTVSRFSAAAHREEFLVAARYLQVAGQSPAELENLARDLNDLLDRYFTAPIASLSLAGSGEIADGLEPDRERIPLRIGSTSVDLFLTRVTDPSSGSIWLFSADSLALVPTLHQSRHATWIEQRMPASLVSKRLLGLSLAQWILWAASVAGPFLFFWSLALLVGVVARRRISDPTKRVVFVSWWKRVRWLVVLALALAVHLAVQPLLGFSLTFRLAYVRRGLVLAVIIGAMLAWQVVSATFNQARLMAMRRGRSDTRSLILLGERLVKVLVVVIAVLGLLRLGGVDVSTALAGLGIAGVAVALGAQKSIENLLGGIFLLTDKVLAVGDHCRLADREGWVEDITLRSVRLRTVEQTLLSVPAGILAQGSIENLTARSRILIQSTVPLRYDTTGAQLQAVLDGSRRLLAKQTLLDPQTARIRLIAFGRQAIELELFAHVLSSDVRTFLEVRESLLLQIADVVEAAGTAFASPVASPVPVVLSPTEP